MHIANQATGGEPFTAGCGLRSLHFRRIADGVVCRMAATTNNQCKWLTGGMLCNQGFDNFDDLMVHLGRVHSVRGSAADMLVCQWLTGRGYCGKTYRRGAFRRHIGTHVGPSVSCAVCGKCYSRNDSMRAHWKKEHGNN